MADDGFLKKYVSGSAEWAVPMSNPGYTVVIGEPDGADGDLLSDSTLERKGHSGNGHTNLGRRGELRLGGEFQYNVGKFKFFEKDSKLSLGLGYQARIGLPYRLYVSNVALPSGGSPEDLELQVQSTTHGPIGSLGLDFTPDVETPKTTADTAKTTKESADAAVKTAQTAYDAREKELKQKIADAQKELEKYKTDFEAQTKAKDNVAGQVRVAEVLVAQKQSEFDADSSNRAKKQALEEATALRDAKQADLATIQLAYNESEPVVKTLAIQQTISTAQAELGFAKAKAELAKAEANFTKVNEDTSSTEAEKQAAEDKRDAKKEALTNLKSSFAEDNQMPALSQALDDAKTELESATKNAENADKALAEAKDGSGPRYMGVSLAYHRFGEHTLTPVAATGTLVGAGPATEWNLPVRSFFFSADFAYHIKGLPVNLNGGFSLEYIPQTSDVNGVTVENGHYDLRYTTKPDKNGVAVPAFTLGVSF